MKWIDIKNLVRINLIVAIIVGLFAFVFVCTLREVNFKAVLIAVGVIVDFLLIGFINIMLLQSRFIKKSNPKFQFVKIFILGSIFGFIWFYFSAPLRSTLLGPMDRGDLHSISGLMFMAVKSLMANTCIILVYRFIFLQQEKLKIAKENGQLKLANVEAANQLLKQQIQPHFLFNALNTLKGLYKTNPHTAENYLIHLADFLRASISYTDKKLIQIADEVTLCNTYMEMQSIRFGMALQYSYEASLMREKGYIPSFSLQPLLENAIKHNEITDDAPLAIHLYIENGYVIVRNNLQLKRRNVASTGRGLMNLTERYQLLSGDHIQIKETQDYFSVAIKIL